MPEGGHWAIGTALHNVHRLDDRDAYRGRKGKGGRLLYSARSEHRESCILTGSVLLRRTSIRDLRVVYGPKHDQGITVADIATEAGISEDRVSSALRTFYSLGWIRGYQPRDRTADGGWIARVKIRWITYDLLRALGRSVVRAFNRARGLEPSHKIETTPPATPTPPATESPIDPRDSWPDD